MGIKEQIEYIKSQEMIINSQKIEIDELDHKVRYQNILIANLKAEINMLKRDVKSFLGAKND